MTTLAQRRDDFPVLATMANGHRLVYLDNAATSQKPQPVIDRMNQFLSTEYATVHRGVYTLSQHATVVCESVRDQCQRFIGAADREEIIFVRGATEAINLVAASYGRAFCQRGDEIVISAMEHHANIVPWQRLCMEKDLTLKVIPMNDRGELMMEKLDELLSEKTAIVAVAHMSNALGTINPVEEITRKAHAVGAKVLIDGAQAIAHGRVDVQKIGCDFYCFSSHKMMGPTGVGVLYGKKELLNAMPPYQCGGEMIETVTFEQTTFAKSPARFEAGTPAIVEIVGLGSAIDYLEMVGLDAISDYENALLREATEKVGAIAGVRLIGTAEKKAAVLSFVIDGIHPHDIGTILDSRGIAVRAGHHCAQPVMQFFGLPATARASLAFYNTSADIDALVDGICYTQKMMGRL